MGKSVVAFLLKHGCGRYAFPVLLEGEPEERDDGRRRHDDDLEDALLNRVVLADFADGCCVVDFSGKL